MAANILALPVDCLRHALSFLPEDIVFDWARIRGRGNWLLSLVRDHNSISARLTMASQWTYCDDCCGWSRECTFYFRLYRRHGDDIFNVDTLRYKSKWFYYDDFHPSDDCYTSKEYLYEGNILKVIKAKREDDKPEVLTVFPTVVRALQCDTLGSWYALVTANAMGMGPNSEGSDDMKKSAWLQYKDIYKWEIQDGTASVTECGGEKEKFRKAESRDKPVYLGPLADLRILLPDQMATALLPATSITLDTVPQ